MLVVVARDRPVLADDRGPTAEQFTERTQTFGALWDALWRRTAGLKIRVSDELVSTGEFDGARVTWLRSGFSIEGGAPITDSLSMGLSPFFAWEHMRVDDRGDFAESLTGRDDRATDFYESGLRIGAAYTWNEEWGGELVTGFSARHESGARYVDLSHRLSGTFRLRGGLGIVLDEELSVNLDKAGDVFTRRNRDPSVTFGLGLDVRL